MCLACWIFFATFEKLWWFFSFEAATPGRIQAAGRTWQDPSNCCSQQQTANHLSQGWNIKITFLKAAIFIAHNLLTLELNFLLFYWQVYHNIIVLWSLILEIYLFICESFFNSTSTLLKLWRFNISLEIGRGCLSRQLRWYFPVGARQYEVSSY